MLLYTHKLKILKSDCKFHNASILLLRWNLIVEKSDDKTLLPFSRFSFLVSIKNIVVIDRLRTDTVIFRDYYRPV